VECVVAEAENAATVVVICCVSAFVSIDGDGAKERDRDVNVGPSDEGDGDSARRGGEGWNSCGGGEIAR